MKKLYGGAAIAAAFVLGFAARGAVPMEPVAHAQSGRVFELRTYTAPDGKLAELHARFEAIQRALSVRRLTGPEQLR